MSENDEKKICNNIIFPNKVKKSSYFLKNTKQWQSHVKSFSLVKGWTYYLVIRDNNSEHPYPKLESFQLKYNTS